MDSSFAYSGEMQLILFFSAMIYDFVIMYCIAKLILRIHDEEATVARKTAFAFLGGVVLYTWFAYVVYFLGGNIPFSDLMYRAIASPNPLLALVWCLLGIKILRLSSARSIEVMGNVYLYFAISVAMTRLVGSMFFLRSGDPFNYMHDFYRIGIGLAVFLLVYFITNLALNRYQIAVTPKTNVFVNKKKDLAFFLVKAVLIYLCLIFVPLLFDNSIVDNSMVLLILVLYLVFSLFYKRYQNLKADLYNKEMHIASLIKASDEFRAIKHDFFNILHAYSGYFALEDYDGCKRYHDSLVATTVQAGESLDLNARLPENPALIALLLEKRERARLRKIGMEVSIQCSVKDLPIGDIDLSRVIACLLDNAIEAAEESESKRLSFVMEQKTDDTRMAIITNSTSTPVDHKDMFTLGKSSKEGHLGIGLNNVRKAIGKYANCTFQMDCCRNEVVVHLEFKNLAR